MCNKCYYYGECVRHLDVRMGQQIQISPFTKKKNKPKSGAVTDDLLLCNHSPTFENFRVLDKEIKKIVLELKESLLITIETEIKQIYFFKQKYYICTIMPI